MAGRKPREKRRFKITLTLYPGRDSDLIQALEAIPPGKRSSAVLEWIRHGYAPENRSDVQEDLSLDDLGFEL